MADDPYAALGLSRGASDEDIRRAFRRLAKECHPDVRPGDNAAAERFKKISQAYDLLGDADKRRRYDRGEIDASGEPRHPFQSGAYRARAGAGAAGGRGAADDLGFGDIFSDLFGGGQRPAGGAYGGGGLRGPDVRYTLEVSFVEAVQGARKRVTMPDGGTLDIQIPAGVTEGQVLRLKGKGGPGIAGGERGDALVEVRVKPHAVFKRVDDDIQVELPITIDEAVLGAKIEVPTVEGRIQLTIPKGTSSGQVLRLRGKGVKNMTTGAVGDLLFKVQIVLPDEVDDTLSYFLSEWRQSHRYDPRRKLG